MLYIYTYTLSVPLEGLKYYFEPEHNNDLMIKNNDAGIFLRLYNYCEKIIIVHLSEVWWNYFFGQLYRKIYYNYVGFPVAYGFP